MATKTSKETKREITRRGDLIIIKEVEKTTTYSHGKEPVVREVTRVQEYKNAEDYKRLPDDIRRQLRLNSSSSSSSGSSNEKSPTEIPIEQNSTKKPATKGNFPEESLREHNKYRKLHGVQPLILSDQLMKVSEERAKDLARKDQMSSRSDHAYGENLSCMWSSDPDHAVEAEEICTRWYSEEKNYNYDEEPSNLNAGHFTQMVWAGSTEFGIAAAKSNSNRIYVVASYSPPGNYIGEFKENVHPTGTTGKTAMALPDVNTNFPKSSDSTPNSRVQVNGIEEEDDDDSGISDLNRAGLIYHNECRRKHGVPPLKYSKELARYAQEWAENLANLDRMEHRKDRKYGENLFCFKSSNPAVKATAEQACQSWYNEIQNYDFNSEPRSLSTGHFTQMIWKNTRELGMGMAKSRSGLQLIVANYNPPGNYIGTFRANCPRPQH